MVKINDLQKHELRDWSDEIEDILRTLSEKAQIWRLLHIRNHDIFKRKYYCLVIPVTILSSFTGAANLALGSIANGSETVVNLVIGALGIIISVISTLNNIFSFQKRKDEHFRSAKDWYRVQRMIDIELSLQKSKRNNVSVFFHLVLQEIERIHEFHPNIRDDVIRKFMKSYKNKKLSIDIPEILTIRKTLIFKDGSEKDSDIKPSSGNTNNQKINKKPQYNKQGTFINMNDDTDRTSYENDKSESSQHILLNTETHGVHDVHDVHDIHSTPESISQKEKNRYSFSNKGGVTLNNFDNKPKTKNTNISKSVSKDIYKDSNNIHNIHNIQDTSELKQHNNSNISLTILEESQIETYDNENSEIDNYTLEIHDDKEEKDLNLDEKENNVYNEHNENKV